MGLFFPPIGPYLDLPSQVGSFSLVLAVLRIVPISLLRTSPSSPENRSSSFLFRVRLKVYDKNPSLSPGAPVSPFLRRLRDFLLSVFFGVVLSAIVFNF